MKKKFYTAGILILLLFLLCYPKEALSASREGMKLWLNTLIPTLLPFLILTGFLIHTGGIEKIFLPLSGFFKKVFGLSCSGAYAFFLGLLCGYPMGAKIASDLYQYGKISRRETCYLLTFSNNASPAFLTVYLAQICLDGKVSTGTILGILILSDLIVMLFFRFAVYHNQTCSEKTRSVLKKETSIINSQGAIIDISIMNGFETITRLGGYILIFSLLSACISHYWIFPDLPRCLLLGSLELTTGLYQLKSAKLLWQTKWFISMGLTAFGGLCIMAQTRSILHKDIPITPYLSAKCLNTAVTVSILLILSALKRIPV